MESHPDNIETVYILDIEENSKLDRDTGKVAVYKIVDPENSEADNVNNSGLDDTDPKKDPFPVVLLKNNTNIDKIVKKGRAAKKTMGPVCNCKLKCYEKVNETTRMRIFNNYHRQDMTRNAQKDFILSRVIEESVDSPCYDDLGNPTREYTLYYTLLVNKRTIPVCQTFFLNTLGLTEATVKTAIRKGPNERNAKTGISQPQRRPEEIKDLVRKHIESMCSYMANCGNAERQMLMYNGRMNVAQCYSRYLEYCNKAKLSKQKIASLGLYRSVASREYNIINRRQSPELFSLDYIKSD